MGGGKLTRTGSLHPAASASLIAGYLAVGCALALWAAGAIFFLLHKASPIGVTPLTWLTYVHFYWPDASQRRLLLLAILLPAAMTLVPLAPLFRLLYGPERDLHGSARFATTSEIEKAGLLGKKGLIVGKYGKHYLQFPGQQFCLLAAPTRSGKGVSFVIPNLLNWPDSCVVLDIKLENFLLTSGFRAKHGQQVLLFNPFAEDGKTHRWNPLDAISRNPDLRVGDILALATSLYPANPGDKDAFWAESARNLFLGLALLLMESPKLPLTLGEILRQSSGKGRGLKEHLNETIKSRLETEQPLSHACVDALNRFLNASDNTLANIISSFTAPLVLFANPLLDAATAASDFDLSRVRDERMTVYVGIQPNRLADAALLINVLFSQLIDLNTRELPSQKRHPHPCLLILDEFPAVGRVNVLAKANAFIAGYNLRLLTIVQSVAQLEGVYGANDARTLITNHAMQVLFTPREQRDANLYSEMLGTYTVKSTSKGISSNRGFGAGGSISENTSDQRRALFLPQELKELPDDDQIILLENSRPIRCKKARYYSSDSFMQRLINMSPALAAIDGRPSQAALEQAALSRRELSVEIPILKIDTHVARVEGRVRALHPSEEIDLGALDADLSDLPPVDDQQNPSPACAAAITDHLFAQFGVPIAAVAAEIDEFFPRSAGTEA